ncbi:hypothetical protein ACFE04_019262 [Oxalis oulophora]
MGNPKQKWTAAEEDALKKGITKHGTGKWKVILRDPEFSDILYSRSNIDLKDKWRNMGVFAGTGPRPRDKTIGETSATIGATSSGSTAVFQDATPEVVAAVHDSLKKDPSPQQYTAMIFEALETINDPNGLVPAQIFDHIKERYDTPPTFRRHLSNRLRKLVAKGRLEKIQNSYKLSTDAVPETMPPLSNQTNVKSTQLQGTSQNKPAGELANKPAGSENTSKTAEGIKEDDGTDLQDDIDSDLELANEFEAELLKEEKNDIDADEFELEYDVSEEVLEDVAIRAANEVSNAENKSFVAVGAVKEEERIEQMAMDTECNLQLAMAIFEKCKSLCLVLLLLLRTWGLFGYCCCVLLLA